MRVGAEYLQDLRDSRSVYVDGERVEDVTEHPGFRGVATSVARLYDTAAEDESMQYRAPETGRLANRVFSIPRSIEELADRREAIERWARVTNGFVGRSPDHVGAFIAGFASAPDVFDRGARAFGANVQAFHRRVLDENLFLSYVIIPPSNVETDPAVGGAAVHVVDEVAGGIVVQGAQVLGTSAAVSDWLFVSCIKPLAPGNEDQAIAFVLPMATPGLRIHCRRPYAVGQPSRFDYPLSTQFDETDAVIVFDDVFVPWEHVFVYRDIATTRDQFHATPAHVLGNTQAQIRLTAKLKFIIGIARKIAAINELDRIPSVVEKLGELAALAGIVEGMVRAAESAATIDARGVAVPNARFVYAPMGLQAEIYPRVLHLLRELAGGSVMQVPASSRDLTSPETRDDLLWFARSTDVAPEDRIKLLKLAWDAFGSEFAGRHHQYEMFYAGAPFVTKGYAYRNYGYDEAVGLVDTFLEGYALDDAAQSAVASADAER